MSTLPLLFVPLNITCEIMAEACGISELVIGYERARLQHHVRSPKRARWIAWSLNLSSLARALSDVRAL